MSKLKPTLSQKEVSVAKLWIGLDVGERHTSACVIDVDGLVMQERSFETLSRELETWIAEFSFGNVQRIGVEAGVGTHLVRRLRAMALPVTIFESRQARTFLRIRQNKTDRNDARMLAELARAGGNCVSEVHLKDQRCQHIQSRLKLRQKLVRLRVASEACVRSLIQLNGGTLRSSYKPGDFRANAQSAITHLLANEGVDLRAELLDLIEICEKLRDSVREVDKWVTHTVLSETICSRFLAIPGVGPITALSFYSAIEDPSRFGRSTDVAAYLGLVPRVHASGSSSLRLGITKAGNKMTRTHLVTAATNLLRARQNPSTLELWGVALRQRIGSGRARVAVARKLSVVMVSMWKHDTTFERARISQLKPSVIN